MKSSSSDNFEMPMKLKCRFKQTLHPSLELREEIKCKDRIGGGLTIHHHMKVILLNEFSRTGTIARCQCRLNVKEISWFYRKIGPKLGRKILYP